MPKIETPRNFADTIWAAIDENWGDAEACYKAMTALIAARDTAIRAECAERAIAWYTKDAGPELLPMYQSGVPGLRAAIMAEEVDRV